MTERAKASKLAYLPVTSFVQNVASRAPVPGGGSVAALAGSMGSALSVMVCRISASKMGDELRPYFEEIEQTVMKYRDRLRDLVDADSDAYDAVIAAGRDAPGDKARAMEANRKAAEVPLETARVCFDALSPLPELARKAFKGAVTDVGVAALMLRSGLIGARYNVLVNLPSVGDEAFANTCRTDLDAWVEKADRLAAETTAAVESALSK